MTIIALKNAELAFGLTPLLDGASLAIQSGDRVGLIGRNGTGKSSLLGALIGAIPLDDGEVQRRPGLTIAAVEQEPVLPPAATLRESLVLRGDFAGMHDERALWAREARLNEFLQRFSVNPDAAPASVSGGERKRAALALAFALAPDLLLLDEPTNHLDFEMRHSLITALQGFAGAVIVVSHDRGLLRSVCDQFWLVADGVASDFEGDLEDYGAWLEKRASSASTPTAPKARGEGRDKRSRGPGKESDKGSKRQEIKSIETSLDKLGQERAKLDQELAGLDYSRDPAHARKVSERHKSVLGEIEQLETRWLELSERMEQP